MKKNQVYLFILLVLLITSCDRDKITQEDCNKRLQDSTSQNTKRITQELLQSIFTSDKQQLHADKIVSGEDELIFERLRIEDLAAQNNIENSRDFLTINSTLKLSLLAEEIKVSALETLYTNHTRSLTNCTHSLSGIQVQFGLATNYSSLKLFYKPVAFCRNRIVYAQGGEKHGSYSMSGNSWFTYNSATHQFVATTENEATLALNRYKSATGIKFSRNGQIEPFQDVANAEDILGDVEVVIYTFQEMEALESDATKTVKLWNSVLSLAVDGSTIMKKHNLVLSSSAVTINASDANRLVVPRAGPAFLDLSHLCPPSCNGDDLTFNIAYKENDY